MLPGELLKSTLQLEEFKGMASCGCIRFVRGKVSLCGSGMEPDMIAAMPAASTCQHGYVSEAVLILGDREGFPELVLGGSLKD